VYRVHSPAANRVPRDVIHRLYQRALCLESVVRFHGTGVNAVSFTQYGLSYADFHETHKPSTALRADLLYGISPKLDNQFGYYGYKVL
jgi:hypothetical protein